MHRSGGGGGGGRVVEGRRWGEGICRTISICFLCLAFTRSSRSSISRFASKLVMYLALARVNCGRAGSPRP